VSYWAFRTALRDSYLTRRIFEGKAFIASHRFEAVDAEGTVQVLFSNPSESGIIAHLIALEVYTGGLAYVDVLRNVAVSTSGTSVDPLNLNMASNNSAKCEVEYGGSYSGGVTALSVIVPGGTLVRAIGSVIDVGEEVIVPEGQNILTSVTNKAGTAIDIAIKIIWWEE